MPSNVSVSSLVPFSFFCSLTVLVPAVVSFAHLVSSKEGKCLCSERDRFIWSACYGWIVSFFDRRAVSHPAQRTVDSQVHAMVYLKFEANKQRERIKFMI